ncbi:MAG: T9SS type A sorting domain-containing protein, partial [Winogradskyella sp.]|nr:T9SS type A sorting domain-containing protein [Winogradskyella sp.]
PEQQYIFEGKPNNGTILVNVTDVGGPGSTPSVSKTDYLLGNPYPSALDIHKFIDDNVGVIDGTLNLWQQWSGSSHNLSQYNGGYAQVNKLGSVRAYQFVGLEGAHNGSQDGITTPSRYLPVGQGFMAEIIADGTVEFNNDQRIFIKEADADGTYNNGSAFFRSAATTTSATEEENIFQKIRLELNSVNGPATRRELLLGFSDATTDAYDYGYEALNTESGANDLNLALDGDNYTMQAYSPITEDKEIPLNFKSSGDYFYEIKITETENVPEDQDIYIRDTYTESTFKLSDLEAYEFSATAGEFNDRFQIVFRESVTLSVVDQEIEALNYYYSNTRDKLVVMNPKGVEIKSIQIFNILGQSVYNNQNLHQQSYNEYPITDLSTGTYVVNMNTESGVLNKKIIINN